MPRRDVMICRSCGGHRDDVGLLSWTRQCGRCGERRLVENIGGLVAHSGEPFKRWRRGMAASVGAVLLDEQPSDVQTGD